MEEGIHIIISQDEFEKVLQSVTSLEAEMLKQRQDITQLNEQFQLLVRAIRMAGYYYEQVYSLQDKK